MTRTSGTRVDDYELLAHLGDGGQSEVYRAKDVRDGSEVVIKFPLSGNLANPVLASRWRREAAITEGLQHPGIICRLDGGERHAEPYIVLEYADGGTLRDWVSSAANPLPVGQAVEWGRQLAETLAFLHSRGVIHRDLKPENVMLTSQLATKLGDFGSAVSTRHQHHRWLSLPTPPEGTAEYLSPEQITGQLSDERSDVYGWGVVMYELLAGQVPFTGANPFAAMEAVLQQHPAALHTLRPDVPPALEAVVMTAMRRHPEHRYPDSGALLADLGHLDAPSPGAYTSGHAGSPGGNASSHLEPASPGAYTSGHREPASPGSYTSDHREPAASPGAYASGPEAPIAIPIGGREAAALMRLILVTLVGFLSVATLAIALTVMAR